MTTNYQQIADEIRAFVESEDQTRDDRLAELAQAYADACKQVNDRLRRAATCCIAGLLSKAFH